MEVKFFGNDTNNFHDGDILTVTISYEGDYGGKKATFSGIHGSVSQFVGRNEIEEGDHFIVTQDSVEGRPVMILERI